MSDRKIILEQDKKIATYKYGIRKLMDEMNRKNSKKEKIKSFVVELFGHIFLIGIVLGIWLEDYRWKFFLTAIFFLVLTFSIVIFDNGNKIK